MENQKGDSVRKFIAVLVLLAAWQLFAGWIGRAIFLPSPYATLKALAALVQTKTFYMSIGTSFLRIATGFVLAIIAGSLLAVLAVLNRQILAIFNLLMQLIKSIPVASFVILILLWVQSKNLSVVISFLMVLPIIYTNIRDGIRQTDPKLLEMAEIFGLKPYRRFRYIYLPAAQLLLPQFPTSSKTPDLPNRRKQNAA